MHADLPSTLHPESLRGIIFDYGGTIDTRGDHWSHIIREGWKAAGVNADDATFRDCYVYGERALARERIILPGDNFHELMRKKARLEFGHYGADPAVLPGIADTVADYCYDYARRCVTEARETIALLAAKYPLVLVSNFYGNIDEVLRDFGLREYFQGIIESAVVGIRKPDPRIFALGCVALTPKDKPEGLFLGLRPEEVLVVGDSLRKDILPARALGCCTAWIKGRGWTADEDAATDPARIPSLATLRALL